MNTFNWRRQRIVFYVVNRDVRCQQGTHCPDSLSERSITKGIALLVDMVAEETDYDAVEVTDAREIIGASYLATIVGRKAISATIDGLKVVVPTVIDTVAMKSTTV